VISTVEEGVTASCTVKETVWFDVAEVPAFVRVSERFDTSVA
jgi:hypothetical protein